ncbi:MULTISPECIES: efflux transporter outer membrane subunit [Cupriavidus]|uniref:efflux transporter outer membrane subunit n=1 Tax=Cupriavidus TaxID=106589 RepID=UPI001CB8DD94|nr:MULTISPECIES: TolC family protein [Cupriavidus]
MKQKRTGFPLCAAVLSAASVMLAACTAVSVDVPPALSTPATFQMVPPSDGTQADLGRWWQDWQDPDLTRRIDAALRANTDLRVARARVLEARAMAAVADSARYPTVAALAGAARGEGDLRSPSPTPDSLPTLEAYAVGLSASWEVDVFGRRASDAAAAAALAQAAEEQWRGVHLAIAADVAQNYLEAQGLQRRLALLDRSLVTLGALQRYTEARFRAGQALAYDVERVREQIAARQAERPLLTSQIEVRQRRLAALEGKVAQSAEALPAPAAFRVPPVPAGELPSIVLERRPDVRATAALLRAQAARLGSAKADLLPRFYLSFIGLDGRIRVDGVPALSGTGGLLSAGVDLPLFNAGRIRSNIAANDARLQAALAEHDKTMLRTLEEVDSAYGVRHGLDQRSERLEGTLAIAQRNADQAQRLYEGGRRTLQDVLDARIGALQREDEVLQAQTGQALATVQLYRALGGGWPEAPGSDYRGTHS